MGLQTQECVLDAVDLRMSALEPVFVEPPVSTGFIQASAYAQLSIQFKALPVRPNDVITYSLLASPSGSTINADTGAFFWPRVDPAVMTGADSSGYSYKLSVMATGVPSGLFTVMDINVYIPSPSPTSTQTASSTSTASGTPSNSPTASQSPSNSPTGSKTPSNTGTASQT